MKCPNCGSELKKGSSFCGECGKPVSNVNSVNEFKTSINSSTPNLNKSNSNNKTIIIVALIAIIAVLAASFGVYYMLNSQSQSQTITQSNEQINLQGASSALKIISGDIYTGSADEDLSHCTVYVGKEHAGEAVQISTLYSRNGNNLNPGNIVPTTVDSNGNVYVSSAEASIYYPSYVIIKLYDGNGNLKDTFETGLEIRSGTQTFTA